MNYNHHALRRASYNTHGTQPSRMTMSSSVAPSLSSIPSRILYFIFYILFFLFPSSAAYAQDESAALTCLRRAIAITDATMQTSFTGSDLRMYDTYDTSTRHGSGTADVWPYTAALEAHCSVLEALEAVKDDAPELYAEHHDRFVTRLRQLYDNLAYYAGSYQLNSYARVARWTIYGVHRGGSKGTATVTGIENVYDDQMWICRELVRAYRLTGDKDYLKEAEKLANYCIDGWDCCLDPDGNEYGGISWGPGYNSKHSCSNGPLIQPLVWLADIYRADDEAEDLRYYYIEPDGTRTSTMRRHSELYLEMARKIYAWQKEKLLNRSTGLYWDMCGAVKGEIQYVRSGRFNYRDHVDLNGPSGTAYTYNTGTMLAGAAELFRVTGEADYQADLNDLCRNSYQRFSTRTRVAGHIFRQWPTDDQATSGFNTWFDNVLMRAYVDALPYNDANTQAADALASFRENLDYAWDNFRRDDLLPIHLLKGWDNGDVTKGFHQLAFAAEYAMLAVWCAGQQQDIDAIGAVTETPPARYSATADSRAYDVLGRPSAPPFRQGLYVIDGRKVMISNTPASN